MVDKILTNYPQADITALFRSEEKAKRFVTRFPAVKPVIGDHTSLELIEGSSKEASIVISMTTASFTLDFRSH